jgi:hypothetical protein
VFYSIASDILVYSLDDVSRRVIDEKYPLHIAPSPALLRITFITADLFFVIHFAFIYTQVRNKYVAGKSKSIVAGVAYGVLTNLYVSLFLITLLSGHFSSVYYFLNNPFFNYLLA